MGDTIVEVHRPNMDDWIAPAKLYASGKHLPAVVHDHYQVAGLLRGYSPPLSIVNGWEGTLESMTRGA